MAGSNGVFAYSPAQAGTWSRRNLAAYGDPEVAPTRETGAEETAEPVAVKRPSHAAPRRGGRGLSDRAARRGE